MCCLVLRSNCALLLTIQFALLFFFFFLLFSATILSGPYLWNRYSQRLQIECAAWSCCLILHYSLPSNSLRYFFFFFFSFFPPRFCRRDISGTVTRRDSRLSVLLGPVLLGPCAVVILTFHLSLLIFRHILLPYLWNRYSFRDNLLLGPCCLFCTLPSNGRLVLIFFPPRFCFAAISLEPSLVETPD